MAADKEFYMVKEVAQYFGVSTGSVRNWVKEGKLKAMLTPGGHRRIKKSEFETFVAKYEKPAPKS